MSNQPFIPMPPGLEPATDTALTHGNAVATPVISDTLLIQPGPTAYNEAVAAQVTQSAREVLESTLNSEGFLRYLNSSYAIAPSYLPHAHRPVLFTKDSILELIEREVYSPYLQRDIKRPEDAVEHQVALARAFANEDKQMQTVHQDNAEKSERRALSNRVAQRTFRARAGLVEAGAGEMVDELKKRRDAYAAAKALAAENIEKWKAYVKTHYDAYKEMLGTVDKRALEVAIENKKKASEHAMGMMAAKAAKVGGDVN